MLASLPPEPGTPSKLAVEPSLLAMEPPAPVTAASSPPSLPPAPVPPSEAGIEPSRLPAAPPVPLTAVSTVLPSQGVPPSNVTTEPSTDPATEPSTDPATEPSIAPAWLPAAPPVPADAPTSKFAPPAPPPSYFSALPSKPPVSALVVTVATARDEQWDRREHDSQCMHSSLVHVEDPSGWSTFGLTERGL